jgi:flagellar hook-associated protein 1 FlgK
MSDLLSLLSLGSAGIAAQNAGVAVATNNVANANTDGYSRQRIDLESLLAAPLVGGVRSGAADRAQDNLLSGQIRTSAGSLAMSQAFADALMDVQSTATSGDGVADRLGALFAKLQTTSATPTDSASREAVVDSAKNLVDGIHRRAAELAAARDAANARIKDDVTQASDLAKHLADTNLAIAKTNDPALRDERDRTATKLAQLVGGSARIDGDGQMRFVLDGGAVLVDGQHAAQLQTTADPTTHDQHVVVSDGAAKRDVTTTLSGGKLAGEVQLRDKTLAQASGQLDQLAFDVASKFNGVHAANASLDGTTGHAMFTQPGTVAGAAQAIDIDPALAADSRLLATAAPGSGPGDNRGALALAGLATTTMGNGKTLGDSALGMIADIGSQASNASADVTRNQLVGDHLASLRDSLAGVDTQEELSNLARFEHASSAMTRFVSTIDTMLGDLIDKL